MTVFLRKFINLHSANLFKRHMHITSIRQSYEGDGKTTVTLLNNNFDYGLMIDNISEYGFVLNNGVKVIGPMVIFPKTTLSWNIATSSDMNEDSFSLLLNLDPKLDIIVIGLDDKYSYNAPFLLNLKDLFKKHKILVEMLPVEKACSTFNFLNSENRYAAAALIPPKLHYKQNILLQKPKEDSETIQSFDTVLKSINFGKDPLITALEQKENDAAELEREREKAESLRLRSPWRKEKKTENTSKFNKE